MSFSPRLARPLRHRAYRWLLGSLTWSLFGEGLWLIGAVWQVVALDGGPSEVSIVMAASAGGMLVTLLIGGAIADRVPQRTIILCVEAVRTIVLGVVATLAAFDLLEIWSFAALAVLVGFAGGIYFPAYSALLPSIVTEDDLLPANGIEGMLRPVVQQGLGPAAGGALVALIEPSLALAAAAAAAVLAGACVLFIPRMAVRRDLAAEQVGEPKGAIHLVLRDIAEGVRYMLRTKWLFVTLLYGTVFVFVVVGPTEVLVPFAIRDNAGGDARDHAWVLAAYGAGGAISAGITASLPLARRYLTVMNGIWAVAALPVIIYGLASSVWPMLIAGFLTGALLNAPMVIWGTLLQRRVPPEMLGRVSSLDFFVALLLMPISMAAAGPIGEAVGLTWTFTVAAIAPLFMGFAAVFCFGLMRDEIEHPLTREPASASTDTE